MQHATYNLPAWRMTASAVVLHNCYRYSPKSGSATGLEHFVPWIAPASALCARVARFTQDGKRLWRKVRGLSLEPTPSMLPVLGKGDVLGDLQPELSGKFGEDA